MEEQIEVQKKGKRAGSKGKKGRQRYGGEEKLRLVKLWLKSDGTVFGWGQNTSGQLGNGNINSPKLTPVQVINLDLIAP